jgi:hypothetical protein
LVLYDNKVEHAITGFADNSYAFVSRNKCDTTTYYSPPCSYGIAFSKWGALDFWHTYDYATTAPFSTAGYGTLQFELNTDGQPLSDFEAEMRARVVLNSGYVTPQANGWVLVQIPVSALNPTGGTIQPCSFRARLRATWRRSTWMM